jgi:hypothetical protein
MAWVGVVGENCGSGPGKKCLLRGGLRGWARVVMKRWLSRMEPELPGVPGS